MTMQVQVQQVPQVQDEHILVVQRDLFFGQESAWHGLRAVDFAPFLECIAKEQQFLPRSVMETDPNFKQIIPYLVFAFGDKLFVMQRGSQSTESRLHNKYTLGIGGHIRQEDMQDSQNIIDWAQREFHEEVNFTGNLTVEPVGIINDDSNPVGQVHVGFVFLLRGDNANISIKSELKHGELMTFEECKQVYSNLEGWSQMVFDHLNK